MWIAVTVLPAVGIYFFNECVLAWNGLLPWCRASQSRQAVIEAVRELLTERRLDDLTVNQIVERAQISRPTFYAHFETKYSVIAALVEDMGESVFDTWRPFFDGEGPIDEELAGVLAPIWVRSLA